VEEEVNVREKKRRKDGKEGRAKGDGESCPAVLQSSDTPRLQNASPSAFWQMFQMNAELAVCPPHICTAAS